MKNKRSSAPPSSLNVLFIGNSFTARNDLPRLVATIAAADGRSLSHRLISAGGASLRQHWNKREAAAAIEGGGYDYVVLQEQSTLPVKNAQRMAENVRLFDECIRADGSRTALYMTWARRHAPETQDAITAAYEQIGSELGALVLPVGRVWQAFAQQQHASPAIYDRDGSHPSLAGSYLVACVMYGVLFGQSVVDLQADVAGLTEADRRLLQTAAAAH
ncbi:MAG TPA: hypothetical protein VGN72_24155 [Tepidisphaeraceae bacterium]|jgi:hypothetical protein|nr:hypothetical protein [Tepidisphaeraceae bacterium]